MADQKFLCARVYALSDISKEIKFKKEEILTGDRYTVTATFIDTKENRRLNRLLGINLLNYLDNKNSSK